MTVTLDVKRSLPEAVWPLAKIKWSRSAMGGLTAV